MTDVQPTLDDAKRVHDRKRAMTIMAIAFIVCGLIWFLYYEFWGKWHNSTEDAYVNGNMVQLMAQVGGTVIELNTDETQFVRKGEVLIRLDPSDTEVALQKAKADLATTVRQVRQYYANAAQAKQSVILSKADFIKAQLDYKRRVGLVGQRAISREEMQHVQTAFEAAQANYDLSQHSYEAALALVENSQLYTHPMVETAKANLKNALLDYNRTTIVAPVAGIVAKRAVQLGQQIDKNSIMLAIIPLDDTWVDANYRESEIENLRIGQPVKMTADAYSDFTFHGTVIGLNPGTGSAFSLLPPQNATGNWIKILQRVPVRISLDPKELRTHPLQLGLSMRVTTYTGDTSGNRLPTLASEPKIRYATPVYALQLADADSIIAKILKENSKDVYLPRTTT